MKMSKGATVTRIGYIKSSCKSLEMDDDDRITEQRRVENTQTAEASYDNAIRDGGSIA